MQKPELADDVFEIIRICFPMFRAAVTRDTVARYLPSIRESLEKRGWIIVRKET